MQEPQPGNIYWLPAKDKIIPDLLTHLEIDDGCFDHPVIVLFRDSTEQKATILIVRVPLITEIPYLISEKAYFLRRLRFDTEASV